jgi:hypothetical protein
MNIKEKFQTLVYLHDLDLASMKLAKELNFNQIKLKIQKELKLLKVNETILKNYTPNFLDRISSIAWDISFLVYKKNNPNKTSQDFKKNYIGTVSGHMTYKEILEKVATILPENIPLKDIQEFQNISSESLENSIEEVKL